MKALGWMPEAEGFTTTMNGIVYRAARFPLGSGRRGRFGAWAGSRLIGEAAKLAAAQALCERHAARLARAQVRK